ncbi:MAG: NAD(P)-dependent oxidoreductase [Steroidobacteraceae bacterium]
MARVAFVGIGKMGFAMAGRLLAAGHELTVFNRTVAKAEPLVRLGARSTASPREACDGAEAVFSMTADDASSRSVWLGPEGILAASVVPGRLAIECSTLSYDWVMELAGEAAARGLRYIDAPVTGLPDDAASGALTLLVGAGTDDLQAARSLLGAVSRSVIHFGPAGAGTAYKLIINLMGAVQIASAAEGLALAERAGLDLRVVVDAIAASQAASPQVVRNTRRMRDDDHHRDVVFTPALRLKDVEYALSLAGKLGLGAPFGELAADTLRWLCDLGSHDAAKVNESKVIDVARRRRTAVIELKSP